MQYLSDNPTAIEKQPDISLLDISSTAFSNNGTIPRKYTYEGENVNPPLTVRNLPANTKSMVLIVDGLDKSSRSWTHWIIWNIPPSETICENSVPGIQGLNDFWEHNYEGPCPPKGVGKYFFRIYALDCTLDLTGAAKREDVDLAMKNKVLACGQITGHYNWH